MGDSYPKASTGHSLASRLDAAMAAHTTADIGLSLRILSGSEAPALTDAEEAPGYQLEWQSDNPQHLADIIAGDYSREDRERLAREAVYAALKEVRPNPEYADATARTLALDAARYALGLKELPALEGEQ